MLLLYSKANSMSRVICGRSARMSVICSACCHGVLVRLVLWLVLLLGRGGSPQGGGVLALSLICILSIFWQILI